MLYSFNDISKKINNNELLILAGDEQLLKKLPRGTWIGGTIPYFIDKNGGVFTKDKIFVNELPSYISNFEIKYYDEKNIEKIAIEAPENGFTFLIIPASSEIHTKYSQGAPSYEDIFMKPIIGWISGVSLDDIGKESAKVIDGTTGEISDTKAIAIHLELKLDMMANIGIINIFEQGNGDIIEFDSEGFSVEDCLVNGKKQNFYDYITINKFDTRLPIVANYCGAMVNVSFQSVDEKEKKVNFYAPVFKNIKYKIAAPIDNYIQEFEKAIQYTGEKSTVLSCNCILNYLYGDLEGKRTSNFLSPITFGEIAYQLLNQTLVYLEINEF
ncbi:MAG: hypothetical protein ABF289_16255 [Clostridiales bacterium]